MMDYARGGGPDQWEAAARVRCHAKPNDQAHGKEVSHIRLLKPIAGRAKDSVWQVLRYVEHGGHTDSAGQYVICGEIYVATDDAEPVRLG